MTKEDRKKLTLDSPATYQIKVPGTIDVSQTEWAGALEITIESEGDGPPITTLKGELDQAALHGLLRRLYSIGLPLVSVRWMESGPTGQV